MKITKIKLHNIGPYREDNNEFDLSVSKGKNIILIGGKNGAGKTTLLNSMKIALFGSLAYGFKNEGVSYYNKLVKLFNYDEIKKNNPNFCIEISIKMVENYRENEYKIVRKWKKRDNDFEEILKIYCNNTLISDYDSEIIQSKIRDILPPHLMDAMLFDGEEIAKIINEGKISDYIREIIFVNFNINLFEKMDEDINFYVEREKKQRTLNLEELNLLEYQNKFNEEEKKLKSIIEVEKKYLRSMEEVKQKLKAITKQFENYGGLTEKEKFSIRSSLLVLEKNKKENSSRIKTFIEDYLIFYLNYNALLSIGNRIKSEKPVKFLKYIDEMKKFDETLNFSSIIEKISSLEIDSEEILYNFDSNFEKELYKLIDVIEKTPSLEYKTLFQKTKDDSETGKLYKSILGKSENGYTKELDIMLNSMSSLEKELEELKEKQKNILKEKSKIEESLGIALFNLENCEKLLDDNRKEENSFDVARKILKISKEFKMRNLEILVEKIATLAKFKFDEINIKDNYISKIVISPENFEIKIYDIKENERDISILSAGEKQLLISALIWSIFKLSDRNNMFTFDTPLARLDKENRSLFVDNLLKTISDQVLILSTDREIVGSLYKSIKEKVSKEYTLDNIVDEGKTYIIDGYFGGESIEH